MVGPCFPGGVTTLLRMCAPVLAARIGRDLMKHTIINGKQDSARPLFCDTRSFIDGRHGEPGLFPDGPESALAFNAGCWANQLCQRNCRCR